MNQGSDSVVSVIGAHMAKLQAQHDKLRAFQAELSAWGDAGKAEAEDALARNDQAGVTSAVEHIRPQVNHLLGNIRECAANMLTQIDGIFAVAAKEAIPLEAEGDLVELRTALLSLTHS